MATVRLYAAPMEQELPYILLKIETRDPVELSDFVAAFVGLGAQLDKSAATDDPAQSSDTRFYVREVRAGSIVAELVRIGGAGGLLAGAAAAVKNADDLTKAVTSLGKRVRAYFKPGGRDETATKGDLADVTKAIAAIAADPNASMTLAAVQFVDGERRTSAVFTFDTAQARVAQAEIGEHQRELEARTAADHERVLMVFTRTDVAHAATGKRSGEKVLIEVVSPKALPIVYASTLAEERIRHEVAEVDDNVYKKAFDVDVNVELSSGKPVAYRLVAVHSVLDLPEDE